MTAPLRHRWLRTGVRIGAALLLGYGGFATSQLIAQRSALAMLDRLQPGLWELRERNSDGGRRQICVNHGRMLIQIRHPGETCQNLIVEDSPASVTVQYTCRSSGYGRTHIRFENPELAQIDTQGIARGQPFDFSAEARRVGTCAG